MPTIRILGPDDASVLDRAAPDVFDNPVNPRWAGGFLPDPRHHLAVAIEAEQVIGMASAVHYVHPDKPPELWINEVSVSEPFRERGIGRRLLGILFDRARSLGCRQAWVATEPGNAAARRLYAASGGVESPEPFVMVEFDLEQ